MALANEEHHQKQEVMKLLYTVSCSTVAEDRSLCRWIFKSLLLQRASLLALHAKG